MAETILVTGATGFLGRHLCRALVARGWDVRAMRRQRSNVEPLRGVDVDWVVGDVLDLDAVREAATGCDRAFHFAGVGLTTADAATVRRVNVEGTRTVLAACRERGVDRLVFASTAGTRRHPDIADETDVASPIGAYQESKAAAERLVDAAVEDGLDAVTVHPTSVFGPGDEKFTARLVKLAVDPKMLAYLPGGASIVGVADVVDGTIAAAERGAPGEHYLLGGENLTYGRALAVIADRAGGRSPPLRVPAVAIHAAGPVAGALNRRFGTRLFPFDAEMARLVTGTHFYTSAKAERELGYEYAPLEAHLDDALRWYRRAHGDRAGGDADGVVSGVADVDPGAR